MDNALQKCLSTVDPHNLSLNPAQARKTFLEQGKVMRDSFYILGKQNLVQMQLFKADLKAQSVE